MAAADDWPPTWNRSPMDLTTQLQELTAHVHACIEMISRLLAQSEHRQYGADR